MEKEPELVAQTLDWCNERRKEKGQEPLDQLPKGMRYRGESCPCGNACGFFVGRHKYYPAAYVGNPTLKALGPIPYAVTRFTFEFDQGNFPQYDALIEDKNAGN